MSQNAGSLVIRADAGTQMGAGHLLRCLALAQGWQETRGDRVVVVTECRSPKLLQRLGDSGLRVEPAMRYSDGVYPDSTEKVMSAYPDAWVVLDGYHFGSDYQRWIRNLGHPLLVLDDMAHLEHYYADLVVNQNLHAHSLSYSCEEHTHLLLGTRYALLRREFWSWRGWIRTVEAQARKVLITLGGSDPEGITLRVIESLDKMVVEGLEAIAVAGPSNARVGDLKRLVGRSRAQVRIAHAVSDMAALMAWADVCVAGAGSTCWELAFMGLPSAVVTLAPNQQGIAESLSAAGVVLSLGELTDLSCERIADALEYLIRDSDLRMSMSESGRGLVDSRGAERVAEAMRG